MSIFKRSSGDVQQSSAAAAVETITPGRQSDPQAGLSSPLAAPGAAPGVVPPPAAPMYSVRPPESQRGESGAESSVAEKVRKAKEAQQNAQERIRLAVRRARSASPPPGVQRRPTHQMAVTPQSRRHYPSDPAVCAQNGLLSLAWSWQEAGAPIRAIHTYVELLMRYPDTPATAAAVADLVTLSEKLAGEGQFHTALAIYDHLEYLA